VYSILATLVVALHFAYIVFVVAGGFLTLRRPRFAWLHLPAAAWGAYVEFSGRVCPLTPLENRFRRLAGGPTYEGGFIDRYLTGLIYPEGLTRELQVALGVGAIVLNLGIYAWVLRRRWVRARDGSGASARSR